MLISFAFYPKLHSLWLYGKVIETSNRTDFFEIFQQIKYMGSVLVKFHHKKTENFGKKDLFIFTKQVLLSKFQECFKTTVG